MLTESQLPLEGNQTEAVRRGAAALRVALESGDIPAASQTLAPDVVFHSPIVFQDYVGREAVTALLTIVARVFVGFHYVREFAAPDGHALVFRATVGGRDLEGIDILTIGEDGLIHDFTVMVRPYSAATALREAMAARMAAAGAPPVA